jgi:hypothetical protein
VGRGVCLWVEKTRTYGCQSAVPGSCLGVTGLPRGPRCILNSACFNAQESLQPQCTHRVALRVELQALAVGQAGQHAAQLIKVALKGSPEGDRGRACMQA